MTPPQSKLMIISGVPFNSNYKDILLFTDDISKYNYFSSRAKFPPINDVTYMRNQPGTPIRVDIPADSLRDCNYIMYQNSAYGSKWFYAFITSVEYVNDGCSFIYFQQDIFQTWGLQAEIMPSFIEREHTNNDAIGANTLPENVELGPYVTTAQTEKLSSQLLVYMMASDTENVEHTGDWYSAAVVSGYPLGCKFKQYGTISQETMNALQLDIDAFAAAGKLSAIVAVFCAPTFAPPNIGGGLFTDNIPCAPRTLSFTPKNNKLYTFPYVSCSVFANGQSDTLRYELFSNNAVLALKSTFGVNAQTAVFPLNYEGISENTMHELVLSSWPLLPWVGNYYQNWIANNKANLISNVVGGAVSIGAGLVGAAASGGIGAGAAAGAVASGVSLIGSTVAQVYNANIVPDKLEGSANASDVNAIAGLGGFFTFCRSIRPEYGKVIDDFFSMFGYKTNRVKVPNLTGRKSWNFVKTISASVKGAIPQDVARGIENILNNGVTFWHSFDVGNYNLDNSIV